MTRIAMLALAGTLGWAHGAAAQQRTMDKLPGGDLLDVQEPGLSPACLPPPGVKMQGSCVTYPAIASFPSREAGCVPTRMQKSDEGEIGKLDLQAAPIGDVLVAGKSDFWWCPLR